MRAALLTAAVAAVVLVPTATTAQAAPCRNLLTDPTGDADFLGTSAATGPVESGQVSDLVSADLRSDRKALTVVIRTASRSPESSTGPLDHAWELAFSTATERYIAFAERSRTGGDDFTLYRVIAGENDPESGEPASASAAEGVDTVVTGAVDDVKGVIRMVIPISAFAEYDGLGRQLSKVRALAWTGNGVYGPGGGGVGSYGSSDFGSTTASYAVGAKSCA